MTRFGAIGLSFLLLLSAALVITNVPLHAQGVPVYNLVKTDFVENGPGFAGSSWSGKEGAISTSYVCTPGDGFVVSFNWALPPKVITPGDKQLTLNPEMAMSVSPRAWCGYRNWGMWYYTSVTDTWVAQYIWVISQDGPAVVRPAKFLTIPTTTPNFWIRVLITWADRSLTWTYNYQLQLPKPAIKAVVNGATFQPGISPGSWVTISGVDLSPTTRQWQTKDFVGNRLPTQLDGVSATIGGRACYVSYISASQINCLAGDTALTGQVDVQVSGPNGPSDVFRAQFNTYTPALFVWPGLTYVPPYVIAHTPDGAYLGRPGMVAGLTTRPARPGDTITVYGTGFGPTQPDTPSDASGFQPAVLATPATFSIGGVGAQVLWAGKVGAGVYQFNLAVPAGVSTGDLGVTASIGAVSSPATALAVVK